MKRPRKAAPRRAGPARKEAVVDGKSYRAFISQHCAENHHDGCLGIYAKMSCCTCVCHGLQHAVDPTPVPAADPQQDDLLTLLET